MRFIQSLALAPALALIATCAAPAVADTTDTYDFKLERPTQVGQVVQLQGERHDVMKVYIYQGNHEMLLDENTRDIDYILDVTVDEVDGQQDVSAATIIVKKWRHRHNGASAARLPTGTIIKATRGDDDTNYDAEGITLTPDVVDALKQVFDVDRKRVSDDAALGPGKPVKVGESWQINREVCARGMQEEGLDAKAENISGTGKLLEIKTIAGVECAIVQFEMNVDKLMPPIPGMENATLLNGTMRMTLTGAVPMDDVSPEPLEMKAKHFADATLEADTPGGRQKVRFTMDTQRSDATKVLKMGKGDE